MFAKAKRFEENKDIRNPSATPRPRGTQTKNATKPSQQKLPQQASNTKKCFICDTNVDYSCPQTVVTHSVSNPGNKIVHCEDCYKLLASKTFRSIVAKVRSELHDFDVKLQDTNEKLIETDQIVTDIEKQINDIQLLLEKCNKDINNNHSFQIHDEIDVEQTGCRIPKAVLDNVQDRLKRTKRVVLFNVPYYEEDKEEEVIGGISDYELIVHLMKRSGLWFEPIECFRVLNGRNADSPRPPLIVEFSTENHKYTFLRRCRARIDEFKSCKSSLQREHGDEYLVMHYGRKPSWDWMCSLAIAPDRTYADRKLYKALKEQMIARNSELENSGKFETKWIIKDLSLQLIKNNERVNVLGN